MRKVTRVLVLVAIVLLAVAPTAAYALTPSTTSSTATRNAIAYNWTFYTRGYYENNCLAYATGYTTVWIWPWGSRNPNLTEVTTYMTSQGYMSNSVGPKRVFCYGGSSNVTHFSKNLSTSSDQCRAKWGHYEVFTHSTSNPYRPSPYGPKIYTYSK